LFPITFLPNEDQPIRKLPSLSSINSSNYSNNLKHFQQFQFQISLQLPSNQKKCPFTFKSIPNILVSKTKLKEGRVMIRSLKINCDNKLMCIKCFF
jgi:hypothetical protein